MDQSFLLQVELQIAIPTLVGLSGIGLTWARKRLKLQEDATANQVIQNAVANFAGKVASAVSTGQMHKENALGLLIDYLHDTVGDSMRHLDPSPKALDTMLEGKLAAIIVGSQIAKAT